MNIFSPSILKTKLLSSSLFNKAMSDLSLDIKGVYNHYDRGLSRIDYIYDLNRNFHNHLKNEIEIIEAELFRMENNLNSLDNKTDVLRDAFKNNELIEEDIQEYYEALNFLSSRPYPMEYKNKLQSLESYNTDWVDIDYDINLKSKTYTESKTYGSLSSVRNTSSSSYWYEEVNLPSAMNNILEEGNEAMTVVLELRAREIVAINQISLFPFSKYPIKVQKIEYRDDETKEIKDLYDKDEFVVDNAFNLLFKTIHSDAIYITLSQMHFEKQDNIYNYDLGLYNISMRYNSRPEKTHFLSSKIYPKKNTPIDFYKFTAEDSGNIEYRIIEYSRISQDIMKTFHRSIVNNRYNKINGEELLFREINGRQVCGTRYPFLYEKEADLTIYRDGFSLKPKVDYFVFSNQEIQVFDYQEEADYTIEYILKPGVSESTYSGSTPPDYIRILGIANNEAGFTQLKGYSLKIKYTEGGAFDEA